MLNEWMEDNYKQHAICVWFQAHLPTGGYVEIGNLYIEVHPSAQDINNTQGLCGTFNYRCDDDFVLRDGSYSAVDGAKEGCDREVPGEVCAVDKWYPDDFNRDWRFAILHKIVLNQNYECLHFR